MHGGVGDTGVSYVITVAAGKGSSSGFGKGLRALALGNGTVASISSKMTTLTFGLSRSLGGGATLKFEHSDVDSSNRWHGKDGANVGVVNSKSDKSSTGLWLQVDF